MTTTDWHSCGVRRTTLVCCLTIFIACAVLTQAAPSYPNNYWLRSRMFGKCESRVRQVCSYLSYFCHASVMEAGRKRRSVTSSAAASSRRFYYRRGRRSSTTTTVTRAGTTRRRVYRARLTCADCREFCW